MRTEVLMITYRSAGYLGLSLPRLLDTCGPQDRVALWQNGDDEATLESLRPFLTDPRISRYHHSRENVRLRDPTNWLWAGTEAEFVSKVDDDCLVSPGWLDTLAQAHHDNPDFGVIGSWRHPEEDVDLAAARPKIHTYPGGHQLLRNLWVQGSGYLLQTSRMRATGPLGPGESFTGYCLRVARGGGVNGFYFPFLPEDHMDDPRSPHTLIRSDADLLARLPLSAQANGVRTVQQWEDQLRQSARVLQTASLDPRAYRGWRRKVKVARRRARTLVGRPARW